MSTQSDRMVQEMTQTEPVESVVWDEQVGYVWVDADGRRVSPIHTSIGPALTYVSRWNDLHDRIERQAVRAQATFEENKQHALDHGATSPRPHDLDKFERDMAACDRARTKLTLTGEPPARLLRMVTRVFCAQPTELEQRIAAQALEDEFGGDS